MKTYLAVLAMSGAFLFEWSFGAVIAGKTVFVPVAALVFCFLIWRMEFRVRIWFALIVGIIMDTVQLVPFGVSLFTCILLALICEVFQIFFSNTESRITQSISTVLLMLIFLAMVPLLGFLFGKFA